MTLRVRACGQLATWGVVSKSGPCSGSVKPSNNGVINTMDLCPNGSLEPKTVRCCCSDLMEASNPGGFSNLLP